MTFSISTVETEIRKLLRSGIRTALKKTGAYDIDGTVSSLLEQLTLILILYPESVFSLFGRFLKNKRQAVSAYLDTVRAFYSSNVLAGLPPRGPGVLPDPTPVLTAANTLRVFDEALLPYGVLNPTGYHIVSAQENLQTFVDGIVSNLTGLTNEAAETNIKNALSALETAYDAIDLSDLEDYAGLFEQLSLQSRAFGSLVTQIRTLLTGVYSQVQNNTKPTAIGKTLQFLSVLVETQRLLQLYNSTPQIQGVVVVPLFSDLTFPEDDLICSGTTGTVFHDWVILEGSEFFPLLFDADPENVTDETTSKVKVQSPWTVALSFEAETVEDAIGSFSGAGDPVLVISGEEASRVDVNHLTDPDGYFYASGVQAGDYLRVLSGSYWFVVDSLGDPLNTELYTTGVPSLPAGTWDYEIYRPTTNTLLSTETNLGESLLFKRVDITGGDSAYIINVVDEQEATLSEDILDIDFSSYPPVGVDVDFEIFDETVPSSRKLSPTASVPLFSYNTPSGTFVRLTSASETLTSTIHRVCDDDSFLLTNTVTEGTYTILVHSPVRVGDRLFIEGAYFTITDILSEDLFLVNPEIPATWANKPGKIVPPEVFSQTRIFRDASATFVTDGVESGYVLLALIDNTTYRSLVDYVESETTLHLKTGLPVEKTGISYRILRKEDDVTELAQTASSLVSVLADDVLSPEKIQPRTITSADTYLHFGTGTQQTDEACHGIVTRNGATGYGHYALVQSALFGGSPTTLRDPDALHDLIGTLLFDLNDMGTLLGTDTPEWVDPGMVSETTDQLIVTSLSTGTQFGDAIYLSLLVDGDPVDQVVYIRETTDDRIRFFPPVPFVDRTITTASARRTKVSNVLYEVYQSEQSALAVLDVLDWFVSPISRPIDALLSYAYHHHYDRFCDLLIEGELETIAVTTNKGLSRAGRVAELIGQLDGLLGEEEDPTEF